MIKFNAPPDSFPDVLPFYRDIDYLNQNVCVCTMKIHNIFGRTWLEESSMGRVVKYEEMRTNREIVKSTKIYYDA